MPPRPMLGMILRAGEWEDILGAWVEEGVTVTPTGKALMGVTRTCHKIAN
jgi:hypothetical protein